MVNKDRIQVSGLLPVNKESGVISKDVERKIVSRFGRFKIGHVGTLDPMASGVLPLLFGDATKLQDYFDSRKVYSISVTLGTVTDSFDITGKVVEKRCYEGISLVRIEEVIKKYLGSIVQIPPVYSAVKFNGKALYSYAARGKEEELDMNQFKRKVYIYDIRVEDYSLSRIDLRVECSKGTYMRTLASDIGEDLGCGGCLSRIERICSSGIDIKECVCLDEILQCSSMEEVQDKYMVAVSDLKLGIPTIELKLDNKQVDRLFNGLELPYLKSNFMDDGVRKEGLFLFKNLGKVGLVELSEHKEDKDQNLDTGYVFIKLRRGIC